MLGTQLRALGSGGGGGGGWWGAPAEPVLQCFKGKIAEWEAASKEMASPQLCTHHLEDTPGWPPLITKTLHS